MENQEAVNFKRITQALEYIGANFKEQPSLESIARQVHLSPFHFQRLFSDWAGVSPKKFLQYVSLAHAKNVLSNKQATLFDAATESGLSGISRLHDLFINIEGMTPGEYKNGGENLAINYSYAESKFGKLIIASTTKGVCHIAFCADENVAFTFLQNKFPKATYSKNLDSIQQKALQIFKNDWSNPGKIKLHLKGSEFQLKVWEALLKIPEGKLVTYSSIASVINKPAASRAVGTAIGSNPIAFIIPCHRVIQASGALGGYMWGTTRKMAMIGWEAAYIANKKVSSGCDGFV